MRLVRLSAGLTLVLQAWRLCVLLRLSFDAIAQQVAVIRIEYFRLRFGTGILPILFGIAWTLRLRVVRHFVRLKDYRFQSTYAATPPPPQAQPKIRKNCEGGE